MNEQEKKMVEVAQEDESYCNRKRCVDCVFSKACEEGYSLNP